MRTPLIWSAAAVVCAAQPITQMQFTLSVDGKQFRSGDPIRAQWKLRNGTNRPWVIYRAKIGSRESYPQISLTLDGPAGRIDVDLQAPSKASTFIACRLMPGETMQTDFSLSDWLNAQGAKLSPGEYKISAAFNHPASEMRPMLTGSMAGKCGASGGESVVQANEVWGGTLAAPVTSFVIR
ncbi:MAG TPA: hypothetical protein VKB79_10860 [Bryobacteraceae bacterium]|nr:hypothetical protein [Bryobacteraceae bacterium]